MFLSEVIEIVPVKFCHCFPVNFVHLCTLFDCIVLDFLYEYVKCASFVLVFFVVFLCVYFLLFVCNACQKKE